MKNLIKYISLLVILSFTACQEDENSSLQTQTFNNSPNFASFVNSQQSISVVVDNNEEIIAKVDIVANGPTLHEQTEDIVASISADPASTAIEGIHYRLNATTVVLKKNQNYIGSIPITILTEAIDINELPFGEAPKLILIFRNTSGADNNLIVNSKTNTLSIIYTCFTDLTGTYTLTHDYDCGSTFTIPAVTIKRGLNNNWHLAVADGGFVISCTSVDFPNPGNIKVNCGIVGFSNDSYLATFDIDLGTVLGGTWDQEGGILRMQHRETFFNGGPRFWNSLYVRQ